MGGLLRDVLRTICGVNQWCYAVFWKFGCSNPKLLIWEESYYDNSARPHVSLDDNRDVPYRELNGFVGSDSSISSSLLGGPAGDGVHLLMNKMMTSNQIYVVGNGIVGRAAFTGNHEWFKSKSYVADAHPPEVSKEVYQQFSAGMQTVAVVPICPHGVVQLGSFSTIEENIGFVTNTRSLMLQLGSIPGVLFSGNGKESLEGLGVPASLTIPAPTHLPEPSCSQLGETEVQQLASVSISRDHDRMKTVAKSQDGLYEMAPLMKPGNPFVYQLGNGYAGAEVIPAGTDFMLNSKSSLTHRSIGASSTGFDPDRGCISAAEKEKMEHLFQELNIPSTELDGNVRLQRLNGSPRLTPAYASFDDRYALPPFGNDLYDIFGVDMKTKLLNNQYNDMATAESGLGKGDVSRFMHMMETDLLAEETSDGSLFPVMDNDQLLDAVVSKAQSSTKKISDDILSCKTTLTKISSFPVCSTSTSCEQVYVAEQAKRTVEIEVDRDCYSASTSIYGSQLSSLINETLKCGNSIQTAYSKKTDPTSKQNKKRLKPGENPRPRPKDRQMIQDRLKELREIIPNGAKCSIDALLERTIKHMLFLQNVTKHVDKLKSIAESKIINKEHGLLSKKNFEGGVTWAFEVGSQSMLCPIFVEDLNSPRMMLIEMLCEERGFFLEIADLIRGMGLTILNGAMETRNGKIWARFIVEADRDVTRMEIFMSLVHLLEQTLKGSTSGLANELAVHQSLHQFASVATNQQ